MSNDEIDFKYSFVTSASPRAELPANTSLVAQPPAFSRLNKSAPCANCQGTQGTIVHKAMTAKGEMSERRCVECSHIISSRKIVTTR